MQVVSFDAEEKEVVTPGSVEGVAATKWGHINIRNLFLYCQSHSIFYHILLN